MTERNITQMQKNPLGWALRGMQPKDNEVEEPDDQDPALLQIRLLEAVVASAFLG